MNKVLTITAKGQVALSKAILQALKATTGDKINIKAKDKKAIIEPIGGGILDLVRSLPKITVPKGKTIEDLFMSITPFIAHLVSKRFGLSISA